MSREHGGRDQVAVHLAFCAYVAAMSSTARRPWYGVTTRAGIERCVTRGEAADA